MKKYFPYLLMGLMAAAIITLFIADRNRKNKKLNERLSFRRQDKIPYGTWVAYQQLQEVFPNASIFPSTEGPGYWDSLSLYDKDQLLLIVGQTFNADSYEIRELVDMAKNGNDIFISARYISGSVEALFSSYSNSYIAPVLDAELLDKKLSLFLDEKIFSTPSKFSYPGRGFGSFFSGIDTTITEVLGRDKNNRPNFIRLKVGTGSIFLQLEPFAFTNYFLLHKDNITYYEKLMSLVRPGVKKVAWDEYFRRKRLYDEPSTSKKGWFKVLMGMENENGQKSFRAAFLLLIFLLLVYTLMEMRRKQRFIPVVSKPRNDSMDFVKTIGRLYYDRGDHLNLARKMAAYFLEHVRSRYKLPTNNLNEEFIKSLQFKSGVDVNEIAAIVGFIKAADEWSHLKPAAIMDFHRKLESFYNKA